MPRKLTIFAIFAFEIALIVFMVAWSAWAQSNQKKFNVIAPPSCLNNTGEQVQFKTVSNTGAKGAAGMAKRDENGILLVYRFDYELSPHSLQHFIDFHECAHHQTGDIGLPHPPQNSPEHMMNESIADCIASMRIRDELINGKEIIAAAILELKKAMDAAGFPTLTTQSRISNITHCIQKDTSAEIFVDGVLKHRGLK